MQVNNLEVVVMHNAKQSDGTCYTGCYHQHTVFKCYYIRVKRMISGNCLNKWCCLFRQQWLKVWLEVMYM